MYSQESRACLERYPWALGPEGRAVSDSTGDSSINNDMLALSASTSAALTACLSACDNLPGCKAVSQHCHLRHKYAPRPCRLPLASISSVPSGVRTTRIRSRLGALRLQAIQLRRGTCLRCATDRTPRTFPNPPAALEARLPAYHSGKRSLSLSRRGRLRFLGFFFAGGWRRRLGGGGSSPKISSRTHSYRGSSSSPSSSASDQPE